MAPPPFLSMTGISWRIELRTPHTLTSKMRRYSASVARSSGPFHSTPALLNAIVEPAEFVDRELDHRLHVRVFRDVGANECCIAAKFLNLSDNLLRLLFRGVRSKQLLRLHARNAIASLCRCLKSLRLRVQLYL
jgi:hypothetical protein